MDLQQDRAVSGCIAVQRSTVTAVQECSALYAVHVVAMHA
jgi:hypothetical protein